MKRTITASVYKGERQYVGECHEVAVVTEGETLDEVVANLREAVALHLEGEDPADFGLVADPTLLITMEVESTAHAA